MARSHDARTLAGDQAGAGCGRRSFLRKLAQACWPRLAGVTRIYAARRNRCRYLKRRPLQWTRRRALFMRTSDIAGKAARMHAESATQAMAAVYDQHADAIEEYVRAFDCAPLQAGMVCAIDGRAVGLDRRSRRPCARGSPHSPRRRTLPSPGPVRPCVRSSRWANCQHRPGWPVRWYRTA